MGETVGKKRKVFRWFGSCRTRAGRLSECVQVGKDATHNREREYATGLLRGVRLRTCGENGMVNDRESDQRRSGSSRILIKWPTKEGTLGSEDYKDGR